MRSPAAVAVLALSAALVLAPAVSGAPVQCGSLGGAVDGGLCRVVDTQPAYTLDITFPLDYPDEQVIVDYLKIGRAHV